MCRSALQNETGTTHRSFPTGKGERNTMKATGIVRRVEEYGILGQKLKKPYKHWGFGVFNKIQFAQKHKIHSKKRRENHSAFLQSLGEMPKQFLNARLKTKIEEKPIFSQTADTVSFFSSSRAVCIRFSFLYAIMLMPYFF